MGADAQGTGRIQAAGHGGEPEPWGSVVGVCQGREEELLHAGVAHAQ